jgi:hypothetical protein
MAELDYLGEQVLATPAGPVELSVAGHEDGSLSVVAWSLPDGRRIGHLHCPPRRRQPDEVALDPTLAGPAVRAAMQALLARAVGGSPRGAPVGRRLVQAGLLTADEVDDLLGWQWLLAELGEPRRLGDLAVAAGLLAEPPALDEGSPAAD